MRSRDARPADLEILAEWVTSQRECELWAGSGVFFPLDLRILAEQIDMQSATNVALDDERGLAAFGQALPRAAGRAHIARVIVRPDARRRGTGKALVKELLLRAEEAGSSSVTLNVLSDNAAAVALYTDLGFRRAERPPSDAPSSGAWFMQRNAGRAASDAGTSAQ